MTACQSTTAFCAPDCDAMARPSITEWIKMMPRDVLTILSLDEVMPWLEVSQKSDLMLMHQGAARCATRDSLAALRAFIRATAPASASCTQAAKVG